MNTTVGKWLWVGTTFFVLFGAPAGEVRAADTLREEFVRPPFQMHSRPLWFWNGPLSAEKTRASLADCKKQGYCGVGILPAHGMTPAFMTPEFLEQYQVAVD